MRLELLLNADPATMANEFGVSHASILIDFAEKILAVDKLKRSSPQAGEGNPAAFELYRLALRNVSDQISLREIA
jgi:hypothetical protein